MVISELPVGSVVRLGRYALGHKPDDMIDIDWIKVSKENDFISQKVLLSMQFDAREGWTENRNYELSNIRQFMNSEQHHWYHPTHPDDYPPGRIMLDSYITIRIDRYPGLLSHFSDEEIRLLSGSDGNRLRLPTVSEIQGGFPYFKRYGKRARVSPEFGILSLDNYNEGMCHRYFLLNDTIDSLAELDRAGNIRGISPINHSGVRPVCRIKESAEVVQTGKNTYKMNLLSTKPLRFFKETQPIDWLLGI